MGAAIAATEAMDAVASGSMDGAKAVVALAEQVDDLTQQQMQLVE